MTTTADEAFDAALRRPPPPRAVCPVSAEEWTAFFDQVDEPPAPGPEAAPPVPVHGAAVDAVLRVPAVEGDVLSPAMRSVVDAVTCLAAQDPVELPGGQALEEARTLLVQVERLRIVALDRLADVDARKLSRLDDAPTTASWVRRVGTSIDPKDVTLARRLGRTPLVKQALTAGGITVVQARKVAAALGTARPHVDRPDGLIDGVDAEQVVRSVVVDGVRQQVCEHLGGLSDTDPRLDQLTAALHEVAGRPVSQLARLEEVFLLLAGQVETGSLVGGLGRLLDALLPQQLEDRSAAAHEDRGLTMVRKAGGGWLVTDGDLDDETGELLHALLSAEMAVDADNPNDTAAYEDLRARGWQSGDPLPGEDGRGCSDGPRSKRQQRHDALRHGLRRLFDSGLLGLRDKVAPHITVTVGIETLEARPGALPAVAGSGTAVPLSLVRAWTCDSHVTRFVMGLGRKVLEASHTQRTLTGVERRAKRLETGGVCQGAGCRHGSGCVLIPHHANPWAVTGTTSLEDTVLLCEQTHGQVHAGHVILLKDGRRLGPDGWVT